MKEAKSYDITVIADKDGIRIYDWRNPDSLRLMSLSVIQARGLERQLKRAFIDRAKLKANGTKK